MNELTKGSKFTYIDSNNKTKECDILCDLETNDKNYIVYTDNTLDESGNVEVYASIYNPEDPNTKLEPIETEKEWKVIETILDTLQEEVKKKVEQQNNEQ